jgi:hypothetical protein
MQNANAAAVELPDADLEAVAGGKAVGKQKPTTTPARRAVAVPPGGGRRPLAGGVVPARGAPVGGCPGGVCPM